MVLILSEHGDVSTDYAIEWLHYYHVPFLRVNERSGHNILASIEFKGSEQQVLFCIQEHTFSLDDISAVWFRRGMVQFAIDFSGISLQPPDITQQVLRLLQQENETMAQYIVQRLSEKRSLNNQYRYNANKLVTLMHAARVGLHIPHSLVTTSLNAVSEKMDKDYDKIITKPVQDIYELRTGNTVQSQYTELLSNYDPLPARFYYSMFQEKIDKKYELRIFFIEEDFYACAIFSPATDGRDLYAGQKLARIVPYRLPSVLREKLIRLNRLNDLRCGSIDIMVGKDNEYYFLEVNPVGQYDYVSKSCNYYLDQKIAQYFAYESTTFQS